MCFAVFYIRHLRVSAESQELSSVCSSKLILFTQFLVHHWGLATRMFGCCLIPIFLVDPHVVFKIGNLSLQRERKREEEEKRTRQEKALSSISLLLSQNHVHFSLVLCLREKETVARKGYACPKKQKKEKKPSMKQITQIAS